MTATEDGGTRMDAAKKASSSLVNALPAGTDLTVLTYGTSTGSADADKPKGCVDVTTLSPTTALGADRAGVTAAISGVKPSGYTPIGAALTKAVGVVGNKAGTVILVSDGIDTCAPPDPCKTAANLRHAYPKVSISTVGFKTDADATKQLSCIASAGDGLFVTAANPAQLLARLTAAKDVQSARTKVTSTGVGSVRLGQTYDQVSASASGFPGWSSGTRFTGSLAGASGVLTVIVWQDCSYIFGADKTLVGIQPHTAGTIDGIAAGSSPASVVNVYGSAVASTKNSDGTYTVLYQADSATGSMYQVIYSGDPAAGGTVVKVIYLCNCKVVPTGIAFSKDAVGGIPMGSSYPGVLARLNALFGTPIQVLDKAIQGCMQQSVNIMYGGTTSLPDLSFWGPLGTSTAINGWFINKIRPGYVLPLGLRAGSPISTVLALPGASESPYNNQGQPYGNGVRVVDVGGYETVFANGQLESMGTMNQLICAD